MCFFRYRLSVPFKQQKGLITCLLQLDSTVLAERGSRSFGTDQRCQCDESDRCKVRFGGFYAEVAIFLGIFLDLLAEARIV